MQETDEFLRARLAFVSGGLPPLGTPKRADSAASDEPRGVGPAVEADESIDDPAPDVSLGERARSLTRVITVKHALVVCALLVLAVLVTVFALGRGAATEVPLVELTASVAPEAVASDSAAPSPPLRVHVAGAVASPGVVEVPSGSIVRDAIAAAGGLSAGADPADLNLAAVVSDGMQILIGTASEPQGTVTGSGSASSSGGSGLVNLNTSTASELEALPGIGPVMAASIVAWREQHGGFTAVDDLQDVDGIGPKTFEKLAPLVTV